MSIKISITSGILGRSPETAVLRAVAAGFHYAELGSGHSSIMLERSPEAWKTFRELCRRSRSQFQTGTSALAQVYH